MRRIHLLLILICSSSFADAQVSYQSGSATFALPIFSWQDNQSRLSFSLGINYSSGNGLKVNDVASNIGQGWNLTSGGSITRMQVGEPDDQKPYFAGSSESWDDISKYSAGYLYSNLDINKGVSSSVTRYPIFKARNLLYKQFNEVAADKELDKFAFQFNGRSGIFILDKATDKGVCLENSRIKIWFIRDENNANNNQIRTTIIAFYIQDENGSIYKFTKYGKTKILKSNYCNANLTGKLTQPNYKNNKVYYEKTFEDAQIVNPYVINEWNLEEIEDGFTHRKINFIYQNRSINANAGATITHYNNVGDKTYSIVSYLVAKSTTYDLVSISWPDGHQAIFNYGDNRFDLIGAKVLSSVDIKYAGRFLSKYEFNTSYFIKNRTGIPVTDYQKEYARLCLKSVRKIGVDLKGDEPPYEFEYYMGSSTPDDYVPASFSHLKDIWGFYNGDYSKDFYNASFDINQPLNKLNSSQIRGLCYLRNGVNEVTLNPKSGYAKNGLLKQINYPTGGTLKFEYEQNSGTIGTGTTQSTLGGVHVARTLVTDGGFSNDCNNPLITNYHYTLDDSYTQSSIWGVESPINAIISTNYYNPESRYFYWKPVANMGCKYRYTYPGILSRDQAIDLTGHQRFMQSLSGVMDVVTAVSQVIDIISIISTVSAATIVAIVIDVIAAVLNVVTTCWGDPSITTTVIMTYNSDINGGNALPAQFKRVEIKEASGQNGRSVLEFTSSDDYTVWALTNPTFSMKQRYAPWAYGLEKKAIIFDANNLKVKETYNTYSYTDAKMATYTGGKFDVNPFAEKYPSCKYFTLVNSSHRSDNWIQAASYQYPQMYNSESTDAALIEIYGVFTGKVYLDNTVEKIFKTPGSTEYLQSSTAYGYDKTYYLPTSTTVTHPDGSTDEQYIYYESFLSNMVFLPNTISFRKNSQLFLKKNTTFASIANGDVKPISASEQRWTIPDNQVTPPQVQTAVYYYDVNGLLIGQKDEGGRMIRHLYDYDNKYVVATVVNADPVNDICAYTSFETANFGGFTYTGAINYATGAVITGKRSIYLSNSRSLSATINPAKNYKVSFYAIGGINVSGLSLVRTYYDVTGMTYYEYETQQGVSSVSVSGTSVNLATRLDEIRLYPVNARMRTVAYDPLKGITEESDENCRVSKYEYDNNGRLRFIKDDAGRVLKMYEYNVANKPPCPVTYSNLAVSEIFTRNNCPAGQIGTRVVYTIPAGTYTSTYSQAAVDAMVAINLAANGQNYANTYGSCVAIYYNSARSAVFSKDDCPIGYVGSTVTYAVSANAYSSLISQADADQQAQDEIDANGLAFANMPGNSTCVISYTPVWEGTGQEYCSNGKRFREIKDLNPNSSSYNQTQWVDSGSDPTCGGCADCTAEGRKCINGTCELGIKVYENIHGHCWYHYEWSDGTWSQNYTAPAGPNGTCITIDE